MIRLSFELNAICPMVCSLSLSKLVDHEFSCALVRHQSIVAYLAVRKLGSIVTNIVFMRRKMAATNMFPLPICFEVCTNIFLTENK